MLWQRLTSSQVNEVNGFVCFPFFARFCCFCHAGLHSGSSYRSCGSLLATEEEKVRCPPLISQKKKSNHIFLLTQRSARVFETFHIFYSGNVQSFIGYNLFLQALICFYHRRHYFSHTIYSKVNLSYCQQSMLMWLKGLYLLRLSCHSGHHSVIVGRVIFCEKQPYKVGFPQNHYYWNSAHYKPLKHTVTGNRELYVSTRKNTKPCSTLRTDCSFSRESGTSSLHC